MASTGRLNPGMSPEIYTDLCSAIVQRGKIRAQCFVQFNGANWINQYTREIEYPIQPVERTGRKVVRI